MSSDRLSFPAPLPRPALSAARLGRHLRRLLVGERAQRAPDRLSARRAELVHPDFGHVAYFSNRGQSVPAEAHPLLLLHGMHLHAGAHELAALFNAFRAERRCYALDLPGFGHSDRSRSEYFPELYVGAIKQLIELAAVEAGAVDVVAVGLTCEYAACAVAALPDMVHTFTMIEPTGFAHQRDQSVLERVARQGGALLPLAVLGRLGLTSFCQGGFASMLNGSAFPKQDPQSIYTRVHCPTLVLHSQRGKARFGGLSRFVRWREHYSERELASTSLSDAASSACIERALRAHAREPSANDAEGALVSLRAG